MRVRAWLLGFGRVCAALVLFFVFNKILSLAGCERWFRRGPDFGRWAPSARVLALAFLVTLVILIWPRRRVRPGHCPCGYDLTGSTSGICPECGSAVKGGGRRYWRDHPNRREGLCGIIRAVVANMTKLPASMLTPERTMRAVWERLFDGPDEVELICMLEKRLHIRIADESAEKWWRTHSDLDMTFGEFSRSLSEYLEPLVMQCVECEYDLTGSVSDVCPECGERI